MKKMAILTIVFLLLLSGCHIIGNYRLTARRISLIEDININVIDEQEKTHDTLLEEDVLNENEKYYISISYTEITSKPGNKCIIPYFKVSGMRDKALEKLINNELEISALSWIKGKVDPEDINLPIILSHNNRFLCVRTELYISDEKWRYNHFVTIDIQTGERVYLKDLIRVDEEFARYFRDGNIVQTVDDASDEFDFDGNVRNLNDFLSRMSLDEILTKLEQCSINQTELNYDESLNDLLFSKSFYVEPNKLIIVLPSYGGDIVRFCINLNDISDFLIVSKW